MKKILFVMTFAIILSGCSKDDEKEIPIGIIDGGGNVYTEIQVGSQTWLKEDLKTTKYIDGQSLNPDIYGKDEQGSYYYKYTLGFDVDHRLCPKGYTVPSKNDFEKLISYLGSDNLTQEEVLENYVNRWNGNPSGMYNSDINKGTGFYWTTSEGKIAGTKHYFYFRTINPGASVSMYSIGDYFHVKCIKR